MQTHLNGASEVIEVTQHLVPKKARTMPRQKPGQSVQEVETDPEFIAAVRKRFGSFAIDLAADNDGANTQAERWIGPMANSLERDWTAGKDARRVMWLNPPYSDIAPWAKKCREESTRLKGRGRILLLVPASVGSNWFQEHVFRKSLVLFLAPRLTFVGHSAPYPKDLLLAVYGERAGFQCWRWK